MAARDIIVTARLRGRRAGPDQRSLERFRLRGDTAKRHAQELRRLIEALPVED